jgi:hypothetical protein
MAGQKEMKKYVDELIDWLVPPRTYKPAPRAAWSDESNQTPWEQDEAVNVVADVDWFLNFKAFADVGMPNELNPVVSPDLIVDSRVVRAAIAVGQQIVFALYPPKSVAKEVPQALAYLEAHACKLSGTPGDYINRYAKPDPGVPNDRPPVHPTCASIPTGPTNFRG